MTMSCQTSLDFFSNIAKKNLTSPQQDKMDQCPMKINADL